MESTKRILFGNSIKGAVMRILLLFVIFTFPFFYKYNITFVVGTSMYPEYSSGEMVVVERNKGYIPTRYDVISLRNKDELWLKRIIGLPGDHIKYGSGRVWLNGKRQLLYEHLDLLEVPRSVVISIDVIVPQGFVWVIGDNRFDSACALVPVKDIVGKVVY